MSPRVLQVIGGLHMGGVETWMVNVLRHLGKSAAARIDFVVQTPAREPYEDEVLAMGARVFHCSPPRDRFACAADLWRILSREGPYDVVHSHLHHLSGLVLFYAWLNNVPVRIAHSHTAIRDDYLPSTLRRAAYRRLMQFAIDWFATHGLAASETTAETLFGPGWRSDSRVRVLHYGIGLEAFTEPVSTNEVRDELGIPRGAFVVGHVGRFEKEKNQGFFLRIRPEVRARIPEAVLLLVGDGSLRAAVEEEARRLGFGSSVVFTGGRPDVARLMLGAMDCFAMPSFFEGVSMALLEAQAAGLPCVLSREIPREVDQFPERIRRLALTAAPSEWADAIVGLRAARAPAREAVEWLEGSSFGIGPSAAALAEFYETTVAGSTA